MGWLHFFPTALYPRRKNILMYQELNLDKNSTQVDTLSIPPWPLRVPEKSLLAVESSFRRPAPSSPFSSKFCNAVTSTFVIRLKKPTCGVLWDLVTDDKLKEIPILQLLKKRSPEVTVSKIWSDSEEELIVWRKLFEVVGWKTWQLSTSYPQLGANLRY